MPKGLIQDPAMDSSIVWVQLPVSETTGRTIQALLHSLANQIKSSHMERKVKRLRIDRESRRIIVEFEEG